jgi:hypothetical protein
MTVGEDGVVSWTPSALQAGTTNRVEVSVSDGVASATASFRVVVVRAPNTSPVIASVPAQSVTEMGSLVFNLSASDADVPAQRLSFALVSGPAGLTVGGDGVVSWRPTEAQGPGTNRVVVRVTDDGIPTLSATNVFEVVVREVNTAPVVVPAGVRRVSEGNALGFTLGASDADLPAQRLTFALVSGPAGLTVSPSGAVAFRPTEAQGPSTNLVVVRVTDDGLPALSATNAFSVIVTEVNSAPSLVNLVNRRIRELSPTSFRLTGRDADLPAQRLTYTLVSGPAGLSVSEDGLVSWTPTEEQGPATNTVTVRVSDDGRPSLSATGSFTIFVTEANSAPTLVNAFNRSILETVGLEFKLVGRDTDLPVQTLSYGLVSGPRGMTVSESGVLVWNPTEDQGPGTNTVVVRVTDDALTPLSTTVAFVVTVRESNAQPVFAVSNLTVAAAGRLAVNLKATDADIPVQALGYRLDLGPAGLTVSTNGLLEWTPAAALANSTNAVRVSVTDGVARVQASFRIVVGPVGSGPGAEAKSGLPARMAMERRADGTLALRVSGPDGAEYVVEASDLSGDAWEALGSVPPVRTLGDATPVEVPIPLDGSRPFQRFRLFRR